jgi:hypothetical protein
MSDALHAPDASYGPPQPTFRPCTFCTCLVLIDRRTGEALTPALGLKHVCGMNCQCRLATPEEAP